MISSIFSQLSLTYPDPDEELEPKPGLGRDYFRLSIVLREGRNCGHHDHG